jgi:hypothetical protein
MSTYKVYPPKDNKRWVVIGDREKEILKVGSVLILKDCEAICERIDNKMECYILVTGAQREIHKNMVVLKKLTRE